MPAITILVRSQQPENRFGRYTGEMLKSEGISDYEIVDVDGSAGWAELDSEVVLLTRCHVRPAEIEALLDYVRQGGILIAFQPAWRLCGAVGVAPTYRATLSAYLAPRRDHPATAGLPQESIQCHWPVEKFDVSGASSGVAVLAEACKPGTSAPEHEAVVSLDLGAGRIVFFFYDPPAAVARIRFGDPDLGGVTTMGFRRDTRSTDLFAGHFDPTRGHLPQADLHCALLANVITLAAPRPVPRLWYYPRIEQRSALPMRSDGDLSTPEQFEALRDAVEQRGGRDTFYLMRDTKLPDAEVRRYVERGHSFGIHSNPHSTPEDPYFTMGAILDDDLAAFRERYGLSPRTTQVHSAFWRGHMDLIPTYERLGLRMAVTVGSFLDWFGLFVAGSCRPMKFVENTGRIHGVFQAPYVLYDDASIMKRLSEHADEEVAKAAELLDACVNVHYSPIGFQSHPVSFATYAEPFIGGVMDEARKRGIPIVSMENWCAFTQSRYDARLRVTGASGNAVACELAADAAPESLVVMVPARGRPARGRVTRDGEPAPIKTATVFGIEYATAQTPDKPDGVSRFEFELG